MDGHVPRFSPERRVNDAGNGDWHGSEWEGSPRRPERIAVICKEVKGMGKSGRRTELANSNRAREKEKERECARACVYMCLCKSKKNGELFAPLVRTSKLPET